ncbi:hypothetical protein [Virgisporangium ochraceum]|uniref:hypothetical protein n=1 Tax=Virgisporangium ochraceum TaxID=65505 RepID=UPI001942C607|nr:hypothetical protein [Virgisporangium ochraceum]
MNVVTLPMALLATGYYTPKLCVRHGEPATSLWPVASGTVRDWPFCPRCMKTRRVLRAVAVACAVVPFVLLVAGVILSAEGVLPEKPVQNVVSGALGVGLLTSWVLLARTSPSRLARASVPDSQLFLVIQGAHPAFAAHAADLLRAAEREQPAVPTRAPVFPTAEGQLG